MSVICAELFTLVLFIEEIIPVDDAEDFIVDRFDDLSFVLVSLLPLVFIIDNNRLLLLVMVSSGSTVPLSIYSKNNHLLDYVKILSIELERIDMSDIAKCTFF